MQAVATEQVDGKKKVIFRILQTQNLQTHITEVTEQLLDHEHSQSSFRPVS